MTHQEEIPVWSYVNIQILYQIHLAQKESQLSSMTIAQLIEKASKHINSNIPLLSFYSPINSGTIFSFLYSLLVVPKELFNNNNNNNDFFKGFNFDISDYFQIEIGEEIITPKEKLFRILRNSIAHVNYLIDVSDKSSVKIWNVNRQGITDVILKSDIDRLSNFAVEFAKYYIQKQNSK